FDLKPGTWNLKLIRVVVKRLDSQTVASKKQLCPFSFPLFPFFPSVPHRQRKHSLKALDAGRSPLFVSMRDYFPIGTSAESVITILEFFLQLLEVIDLTIEHHSDRSILIEDRLMPTLDVNNAQATHSQRQRPAFKVAFVIRPTMLHRRRHQTHNLGRVRRLAE